MDKALSKLYGVQFFFSALTGTQNHVKKKKQQKSEDLTSQEKQKEINHKQIKIWMTSLEISIQEWHTLLPTLAQLNVIQTLSLPCCIT